MTRQQVWLAVLVAGALLFLGVRVVFPSGGDQLIAPPPSPTPLTTPSAAAASPSPTPSPSPSPSPTPVLAAIDVARAVAFAVHLADDIGPRPAGGEGDVLARADVTAAFRDAGYTVVEETFPLPQGGESANVVAWWGTDDPRTRPHVVVGGHLDTIGGPGGNDNASGIGLTVAAAEEFADELALGSLEVPIVWVAFGAEEYQPSTPRRHHIGSEQYAASHAEQVAAMVSVDMLANGARTCICRLDGAPRELQQRLVAIAARDGLPAFQPEARGDVSDHGPFALRDVPAVLLWTYISEGYHGPGDTSDRIIAADLERSAVLLAAFLRDLTADDLPRVQAAP